MQKLCILLVIVGSVICATPSYAYPEAVPLASKLGSQSCQRLRQLYKHEEVLKQGVDKVTQQITALNQQLGEISRQVSEFDSRLNALSLYHNETCETMNRLIRTANFNSEQHRLNLSVLEQSCVLQPESLASLCEQYVSSLDYDARDRALHTIRYLKIQARQCTEILCQIVELKKQRRKLEEQEEEMMVQSKELGNQLQELDTQRDELYKEKQELLGQYTENDEQKKIYTELSAIQKSRSDIIERGFELLKHKYQLDLALGAVTEGRKKLDERTDELNTNEDMVEIRKSVFDRNLDIFFESWREAMQTDKAIIEGIDFDHDEYKRNLTKFEELCIFQQGSLATLCKQYVLSQRTNAIEQNKYIHQYYITHQLPEKCDECTQRKKEYNELNTPYSEHLPTRWQELTELYEALTKQEKAIINQYEECSKQEKELDLQEDALRKHHHEVVQGFEELVRSRSTYQFTLPDGKVETIYCNHANNTCVPIDEVKPTGDTHREPISKPIP